MEEDEWLLAVSLFECTNSVFNIANETNSFSTSIPGHWISKSTKKTIDELNKVLELRSENDIELHTEQVRKKRIFLITNYPSSSNPGTFITEILEELKNAKKKILKLWCKDSN